MLPQVSKTMTQEEITIRELNELFIRKKLEEIYPSSINNKRPLKRYKPRRRALPLKVVLNHRPLKKTA